MAQFSTHFKLAVMGAGGVGKSALTIRLVSDSFIDEYNPTIEDSYRKQVIIDNESAILNILDTAGQEEFSSLRDDWIRSSEGFVLVYSVTNRATFDEIEDFHAKICQTIEAQEGVMNVPVVLVGNKCDARQERVVEYSEGEQLAERLGCVFLETSAMLRHNHEEAFFQLVRGIRKQRHPRGSKRKSFGKAKQCFIL